MPAMLLTMQRFNIDMDWRCIEMAKAKLPLKFSDVFMSWSLEPRFI